MTHRFAPSGVSTDAWDHLTPFQQAVYRALTEIPAGETRSYQWIANRIRRPGSARAVGNALHQNPFAPIVPCHRVIRSDGSLGGYAHGIARKRELLRQEAEELERLALCRTADSSPASRGLRPRRAPQRQLWSPTGVPEAEGDGPLRHPTSVLAAPHYRRRRLRAGVGALAPRHPRSHRST